MKLFAGYSDREVKRLEKTVKKIDAMEDKVNTLTDEQLREKTFEFKKRYINGETLDSMLVEAFAVCREASKRVSGRRHYREQLMGGIVLHQGRIAEMKTGEGKTLVATLPTYLNALSGKGVHVITVNDYLAERDMEEMRPLYEFLGLTVGLIVQPLNNEQRRESYNCDITYGTNNEFGFDYLRDNMVMRLEDKVQRPLTYCIVDEVDSILIDEARTPLIISGQGGEPTHTYRVVDFFAKRLKEEQDYTIDEKMKSVILTEDGVKEAERVFLVDNLADSDNLNLMYHITQALKANYMMIRDKDYMVKNGEVIIIDENTGRPMEGRRFSEGLHQAIEAKENVRVQAESITLATITFQNYFRMYDKLAGMTGTALTEETEFREIYALDVVVIPTHKPIQRIDKPDLVYKTVKEKFKAIAEEVMRVHKTGQPILIGTTNITNSELLSKELSQYGIPHSVLNAKYHEQEASIVSEAGKLGKVTIATNMAGRGTDIKLGDGVREVGGLKIIGTERHESRRIDNQLRGRAGRQGDVGESRFYISLEDDLMRIFGSEKLQGVVERLGLKDGEAIESKMMSKSIENAQRKVEGTHFDIRKQLINYDDVINKQREVIYSQRNDVLEGRDLTGDIYKMACDVIDKAVNMHMGMVNDDLDNSVEEMIKYINLIVLPHLNLNKKELISMDTAEVKEFLKDFTKDMLECKFEDGNQELVKASQREIVLKVVDSKWMKHLDDMEQLKRGIGLRAYKQQDPTQAYQMEGSDMFEDMVYSIKEEVVKIISHMEM